MATQKTTIDSNTSYACPCGAKWRVRDTVTDLESMTKLPRLIVAGEVTGTEQAVRACRCSQCYVKMMGVVGYALANVLTKFGVVGLPVLPDPPARPAPEIKSPVPAAMPVIDIAALDFGTKPPRKQGKGTEKKIASPPINLGGLGPRELARLAKAKEQEGKRQAAEARKVAAAAARKAAEEEAERVAAEAQKAAEMKEMGGYLAMGVLPTGKLVFRKKHPQIRSRGASKEETKGWRVSVMIEKFAANAAFLSGLGWNRKRSAEVVHWGKPQSAYPSVEVLPGSDIPVGVAPEPQPEPLVKVVKVLYEDGKTWAEFADGLKLERRIATATMDGDLLGGANCPCVVYGPVEEVAKSGRKTSWYWTHDREWKWRKVAVSADGIVYGKGDLRHALVEVELKRIEDPKAKHAIVCRDEVGNKISLLRLWNYINSAEETDIQKTTENVQPVAEA